MKPILLGCASVLALCAAQAQAEAFNRIASFPVARNLPEGADPATVTSAEIVSATADGMTLVYTDSPTGRIGFIDIADPRAPQALGGLDMGGEPTSVTVLDGTAFVGVNASESFTAPSGRLATVDVATRVETASCDLGGQPDSVALAPDGSFIAVAIENERDEDVNDGALPQAPAGWVTIVPIRDGALDCAAAIKADLTAIAAVAGDDPEPEFVDVNAAGEIAVTLQENNHVVILGPDGAVRGQFSAGSVDLKGVDLTEDGRLAFAEGKAGIPREPDAVKWIGTDHLAVANEGDWQGGSRGFTVFARDGAVAFESGAAFERALAALGHYPEKRSDAKGVEPEGLEVARFGETDHLFVLAERGSAVGVYALEDGQPVLRQVLPSGVSPEGAKAIPGRGLLVTANEADLVEDGAARSHVMIYALQDAPPAYPSLTSAGTEELIGWGALSGLAALPGEPGQLVAVSDSVYSAQPRVFRIDATTQPARILSALDVTRDGAPAAGLDLEGIAPDGAGGFWLASEGRTDKDVPHALLRVDATGAIVEEIAFPEAVLAGETRYGAEGVAQVGDLIWIAIQREWKDDPAGTVKLLAYDPAKGDWAGYARYPLDPAPEGGWVGLSEIAASGDDVLFIERDNLIGEATRIKRITRVPAAALVPTPFGAAATPLPKETLRDLIPDLRATGGYVVDKVEGLTVDATGAVFVVTDNDGVDDSSGETLFLPLGKLNAM